jgi:hypothetical protein
VDAPKLRLSQKTHDLLAALSAFAGGELMRLLASPYPAKPSASIKRLTHVGQTIRKPAEAKEEANGVKQGSSEVSALTKPKKVQTLERFARRSVSSDNDYRDIEVEDAKSSTTTRTVMPEMPSTTIEPGEAQRLSDVTVQESFARRVANDVASTPVEAHMLSLQRLCRSYASRIARE